jgi:signal transduction histidine kinase
LTTLGADAGREGLHRLFVADEVASALRHRLINKIAAVGALGFHLKRKLPDAAPDLDDARKVLPLIDAELAQASEALGVHFLGPARQVAAPVPLVAAVQEVVGSISRPPGVEISGPEPGSLAAAIDRDELAVALVCLLENAVEAVAPQQSGQIRVSCTADSAGKVQLEVADDGPGLDETGRARAREPFFSTRAGHVGLGLNVAARIALRWHGRLELADQTPRGLRATLVLPAAVE